MCSAYFSQPMKNIALGDIKQNIDFEPQEVTDVKYGRMQKGIPSWLVVAPVVCA